MTAIKRQRPLHDEVEPTGASEPLSYVVTAILHDRSDAERYIEWLKRGHVQAVLKWASRAEIVLLDSPSHTHTGDVYVQSTYLFEDRAAFQRYEEEGAPQLRAEGIEFAKSLASIEFKRSIGVVLYVS